MSVVKINAFTVPPDKHGRFEQRWQGQGGAVQGTDGLEWFEVLRPLDGNNQYLIYTRWSSDQAYQAWADSQDFARAHGGGGGELAPAAPSDSHHLWTYQVIESAGQS